MDLPGHISYTEYKWLKPIHSPLSGRDSDTFLCSMGCLSVPRRALLDDFTHNYFAYIHPAIPVLDEALLGRILNEKHRANDGKISVLVFQALLFAGSAYASLDTVKACGFADVRAARRGFYRRAKILFDLNFENDLVAKAQAATILSLNSCADEPLDGYLWLTRAIQICMTLSCQYLGYKQRDTLLNKRLWWSIVIRDMSLSLSLRRRPQITSTELRVAPALLTEEDLMDEIQHSPIYCPMVKQQFVTAFLEQCQLALLLTRTLPLIFSGLEDPAPPLSLAKFYDLRTWIHRKMGSLRQWEVRFKLSSLSGDELYDTVGLLRSLTCAYYHTSRVILAHYEALLLERHMQFAGDNYYKLLEETALLLHDAGDGLIVTMEYLSRTGTAHILPPCVLAFGIMPLILTVIDYKLSPSTSELSSRRSRLDSLARIFQLAKSTYDIATHFTANTNRLLRLLYATLRPIVPDLEPECNDFQFEQTPHQYLEEIALIGIQRDFQAGLSHNWHQLYLRYPRIYLLIASSVDRWLSLGILLDNPDLPEFLRRAGSTGADIPSLPDTDGAADCDPLEPAPPSQKCQTGTGVGVCLRERVFPLELVIGDVSTLHHATPAFDGRASYNKAQFSRRISNGVDIDGWDFAVDIHQDVSFKSGGVTNDYNDDPGSERRGDRVEAEYEGIVDYFADQMVW
ncbi:hypothetical protein BDV12DRAFT_203756 [Aspergillus spectabilis]